MKTRLFAVCLLALVGQVASAQEYWVNMLSFGSNTGANSIATSINNGGQIAGNRNLNVNEIGEAVLYSGGVFTPLGTVSGGLFSSASHINDAGDVTGWSATDFGPRHSVVWPYNSSAIDLGGFSIRNSTAAMSNTSGQVVGTAQSAAGIYEATLYQNGTTQFVGPTQTRNSWAAAINPNGATAGTADNASGRMRFFTRTADGVVTVHGTLGADPACQSWATDMNRFDIVVGNSTVVPDGSIQRGFTFDSNTGITTVLEGLGGSYTEALCINSLGWTGGRSLDSNNVMCAFVNDGLHTYKLSDLVTNVPNGWRLYSVLDMNDSFSVVGVILNETTGQRMGYEAHIVPSASVVALTGTAVVVASRRRPR